jgi:hypothetical protein
MYGCSNIFKSSWRNWIRIKKTVAGWIVGASIEPIPSVQNCINSQMPTGTKNGNWIELRKNSTVEQIYDRMAQAIETLLPKELLQRLHLLISILLLKIKL